MGAKPRLATPVPFLTAAERTGRQGVRNPGKPGVFYLCTRSAPGVHLRAPKCTRNGGLRNWVQVKGLGYNDLPPLTGPV